MRWLSKCKKNQLEITLCSGYFDIAHQGTTGNVLRRTKVKISVPHFLSYKPPFKTAFEPSFWGTKYSNTLTARYHLQPSDHFCASLLHPNFSVSWKIRIETGNSVPLLILPKLYSEVIPPLCTCSLIPCSQYRQRMHLLFLVRQYSCCIALLLQPQILSKVLLSRTEYIPFCIAGRDPFPCS